MRARTVSIALVIVGIAAAVNGPPRYLIVDVGPSHSTAFCAQPGPLINAAAQAVTTTHEAGPNSVRNHLVNSSRGRAAIGTLSGAETDPRGISQPG
jgi:hypothetical protein